MKHFELKGQIRETGNKAVIKAFRKQGLVPCNLYGLGLKNVLFTVEEKELKGITHTPESFIIDIVLNDGNKYTAVVHELQYHPVKDNCLHVDFLAVNE
ncbi:MAG: 50S ribosomal protein L25, partial [Bacteroidales bacterium]|nr:50S ribosomal protein L25 [Bacteroidales bacterium]